MTHFAQFKRLSSALLLGWAIAIGASSPAAAQCVGDCDNDNTVRIPEVQRCVNIRTGEQPVSSCVNADQNGDGTVSPAEVDACIASFLDAATCPRVTPAATNTVPPATSTVPPATSTATVPAATSTATIVLPTSTSTTQPTATRTSTPVPTTTPTIPPLPTNTATMSATNTPPVRTCAFNGATDNSRLQICFLGVCPAPIDISGALRLTCDPASQDANGKRDCTTALQSFNPFVLSGVGTICIDPGTTPCPIGEVDCDGGNALNQEIIADAQIGACTGNAGCITQCGTYCSGLGKSVYNGACEKFCQGGSRANQACICDLFSGATCSGGVQNVNDCPGGSCEGKDNEGDTDCHCTCIDDAVAPASPAGSMHFRLGIAIRVEADPVCDNNQVLVRLPEQCAPFTTGSSKVTQLQANELAGTQGPWTETGVSGSCAALDTGSTTAFEFVSTLAFLDSTIGDLQSLLHVDCQ